MTEVEEQKRLLAQLKKKLKGTGSEIQSINNIGKKAIQDNSYVDEFRGRFRVLERFYSRFEGLIDQITDLQEQVEGTDSYPNAEERQMIDTVKRYFYESNVNFEKLNSNPLPAASRSMLETTAVGQSSGNVTFESRSSNLPKLSLPRFDGELINWPKFRDMFTSLVHNDPNLSSMEKFHYLITSLGGNALSLIAHVTLEEKHYELAWTTLKQSFEHKRMLSTAYLNQLLSFKPIQGKATVDSLKSFISRVCDNVAAFKLLKLENEADFILFHLAVRGLDPHTREQFELTLEHQEIPTFDKLTKFVRDRSIALQLAESNLTFRPSPPTPIVKHFSQPTRNLTRKTTLLASKVTDSKSAPKSDNQNSESTCPICRNTHPILNCPVFHTSSVQERIQKLKNWHGCRNCLSNSHLTPRCPSKWHCRFCRQRHNSFLCLKVSDLASNPSDYPAPSTSGNNSSPTTLKSTLTEPIENRVILGTALAEIQDSRGQFQQIRLVIDSGSQCSYITQRCLNRLGLPVIKVNKTISCVGGTPFEGAKGLVSCIIRSKLNRTPNLTTDALVVKSITSNLPNAPISPKIWQKYLSYNLADVKFFEPAPIDFLIGADLFGLVMTGCKESVGENLPQLFSTIFGFVIIGTIHDNSPIKNNETFSLFNLTSCHENLNFQLEKFWEIEDIDSKPSKNPDDIAAEEFFVSTHYRLSDGRYGVRLPFRDDVPDLSPSQNSAKRRFLNLESKLRRNPDFLATYHDFMNEYINLGHMEPTTEISRYVIPHHGVTKEDRNQIKLRVVFDASCKTSNGSLNDHLLVGEPLQSDIRNILLNFRAHKFVFVTDAVKMYRQIEIHPLDRKFQHIFWRSHPTHELQKFELKTVTYGLSCAPYLALRVLKQLSLDEGSHFPLAAQVLSRDLYVDDISTGAGSIEEALELQRQVIGLLRRGGFELSKWASNSQEVMTAVPSDMRDDLSIHLIAKDDQFLKILGLQWDPKKDVFSYKIKPPNFLSFTKRSILSTVARIYDPLGFLSPSVFRMKEFVQELWKLNLGWDQNIPQNLVTSWSEIINQLPLLSQIEIPRYIFSDNNFQCQFVGFSDASNRGYCASIYLRIITDSNISVNLLTAKTKLAPVKQLTCPRLELCGAYLLAKLYNSLSEFKTNLKCHIEPPLLFTDSSIVLSWINTPPHKLKLFVGNRVAKIAELVPIASWFHIDGLQNPSDAGSRGLLPSQLINHELWWHGPKWLSKPKEMWPESRFDQIVDLPELKRDPVATTTLVSTTTPTIIDFISRCSNYNQVLRVVALILRAFHNFKFKNNTRQGALTARDLHESFLACVRVIQRNAFFEDGKRTLSQVTNAYPSLNLYMDSQNIIRVGGRLRNSSLRSEHKNQILLPHQSHFSKLLVDHYHKSYLHPGPSMLQALLQTRFWIPNMRRLVRNRTFFCLRCYKSKAKSVFPFMGDLPSFRFTEGRAFLHVGIDFAGPFAMKESNRRKASVSKVYLCLFICMVTKAVHLEAVTSLSTEAFLAALNRFISRRGLPNAVYTDCGTNFAGAARELKQLEKWYQDEQTKDSILRHASALKFDWHFNPPYSPHFGGLWEAGVKSAKRHLRLVAGETPLTYEEISTLFARIEAVLNSRPLCPLSTDPNEADFLSPGHFLIGAPLLSNPEPTLLDSKLNSLSRWQLVKRFSEEVWNRWRLEYLTTLQARAKWHKRSSNAKVGDLVLLKSESASPLQWPGGRITETFPGGDGVVRVVTVATSTSNLKRSVANLVPLLPLDEEPYNN